MLPFHSTVLAVLGLAVCEVWGETERWCLCLQVVCSPDPTPHHTTPHHTTPPTGHTPIPAAPTPDTAVPSEGYDLPRHQHSPLVEGRLAEWVTPGAADTYSRLKATKALLRGHGVDQFGWDVRLREIVRINGGN